MMGCITTCFNDSLAWITALGALCGVVEALRRWVQRIKIQRAEFVMQLIVKLRFDEAVREAGHMIEYGRFEYTAAFHEPANKQIELSIDLYLSYLSYLCYLRDTGSISDKEMRFFEYKLVRTLQTPSVQTYLWNLVHFAKESSDITCSFHSLVMYGINRGVLDRDFLTNSNKYPRILDKMHTKHF